jgi:peptide/nickel transport system permease protein
VLYYVVRRVASALSVVAVTLVATFALFFIAPTDPAAAICGERKCPQSRYNEIRANLHLDEPKVQQFSRYAKGIVVGRDFETSGVVQHCSVPCLGFSFKNDRPVTGTLMARLPVTASLVLGYGVLVLTIGVTAGAMAARRRGIFTEKIFDLPGLGVLALDAVSDYDLPVIMGTVLLGSVLLVAMNLIVDLAYSVIDPRVRLQ